MKALKRFNSTYAGKLAIWLTAITLGLLVLHLGLQSLNWLVYHQQNGAVYELANRFDFDDEVSVPTWYSLVLFLFIGLFGLLASLLSTDNKVKRLWLAIGLGGILASVDEAAGLHEYVLQMIHNSLFLDQVPEAFKNAWFVMLPFILLAAGVLVYFTFKLLDRHTVVLLSVAIGVFLLGAVAVDQVTSFTERESFLHQGLLVGLEEVMEVLSLVVVVYALTSYIEKLHMRKIERAAKSLRS